MEEDTARIRQAIHKWVRCVWDEAAAQHFNAILSDPRGAQAPQTWLNKLLGEIEALKMARPPSAERLRLCAHLFEPIQALVLIPSDYDRQLILSSSGRAFYAFLESRRLQYGSQVFSEIAGGVADTASFANMITPGVDHRFVLEGRTFEERGKAAANAIANGAEVSYRPMLLAALRLTPVPGGVAPRTTANNELGPVMHACRIAWENTGGPVAVLDERIRILRNSEFHRHTRLDIDARTITFVNVPKSGPPQELGPWGEVDLVTFAQYFFDLAVTMSLVLNLVLKGIPQASVR